MSNNNNCLHVFLSEYIWLNVIATNYENQYSLNNLSKYSIEEPEEIVLLNLVVLFLNEFINCKINIISNVKT